MHGSHGGPKGTAHRNHLLREGLNFREEVFSNAHLPGVRHLAHRLGKSETRKQGQGSGSRFRQTLDREEID